MRNWKNWVGLGLPLLFVGYIVLICFNAVKRDRPFGLDILKDTTICLLRSAAAFRPPERQLNRLQ
jgi:hypothetical protein